MAVRPKKHRDMGCEYHYSATLPIMVVLEKEFYYKDYVTKVLGNPKY